VHLWRIAADTPDYGADDRSGKGAEIEGGRWNRPGTPMLYASCSRALASLETLAHFGSNPVLPLNRFLVEITVSDELWKDRVVFDPEAGVGWDAQPAGLVSLDWGTAWARNRTSVLAEVPSVLVPEESNVLIDPLHPEAGRVGVRKVRRWLYDPRLGVRQNR
jgi:RES domain-containing protein